MGFNEVQSGFQQSGNVEIMFQGINGSNRGEKSRPLLHFQSSILHSKPGSLTPRCVLISRGTDSQKTSSAYRALQHLKSLE